MAAIFARNGKAYSSWRRRMDRLMGTPAVSPAALEAQVMALARMHPQYVVIE